MNGHHRVNIFAIFLVVFALQANSVQASRESPETILQHLNDYPHAKQIGMSQTDVIDHEIGLGALQKRHGVWRFKKSERLSGALTSYTWQIVDGFTSQEVMEGLLSAFESAGASGLFTCDGRACGHGAQWASRVFHERLLYGMDDSQRYRVFSLAGEAQYRLVVYSSSRSAGREYLRVDLLRISE